MAVDPAHHFDADESIRRSQRRVSIFLASEAANLRLLGVEAGDYLERLERSASSLASELAASGPACDGALSRPRARPARLRLVPAR